EDGFDFQRKPDTSYGRALRRGRNDSRTGLPRPDARSRLAGQCRCGIALARDDVSCALIANKKEPPSGGFFFSCFFSVRDFYACRPFLISTPCENTGAFTPCVTDSTYSS